MYESFEKEQAVRVLRSRGHGTLDPTARYAPAEGVRYDGLYKIVGTELLDDGKTHRFKLVRELGQDPMRFEGGG